MANNGNGKGNGKRFKLQSLALFLALAAPFGLFLGLEAGLVAVAIAFFAVIVASMLIAIQAG